MNRHELIQSLSGIESMVFNAINCAPEIGVNFKGCIGGTATGVSFALGFNGTSLEVSTALDHLAEKGLIKSAHGFFDTIFYIKKDEAVYSKLGW